MSFESLSESYEFTITDFPSEWLPLTYLYDPDLPLFPLQYFHLLDPDLQFPSRPRHTDRVFGFIHHLNLSDQGLTIALVTNKNLEAVKNNKYRILVEDEVRSRLGLGDPIRLADINGMLKGELSDSNSVLAELWYQVIDGSFGKSLPFGRMWDGVFGLARFIASWNSGGGRKGELIQTHYFVAAFGEKIATGQEVHADFYLLPTFEELCDQKNPLSIFPKYAALVSAADAFVGKFCEIRELEGGAHFSAFQMAKTGAGAKLKTESVIKIINSNFSGIQREALFENYNAFNRGPQRSVISLQMHHDLRRHLWEPKSLTPRICGSMYPDMKGSYQTPKVIQLYAQQCFGIECVLPIDNWVSTFVSWPLAFDSSGRGYYRRLFECCDAWGKVERLIWMASQARKVHSSVAAEILWCVRYGGPDKQMRGANPLSCKICESHIRATCPAYDKIENSPVSFNSTRPDNGFLLITSEHNNSSPSQRFVRCEGDGIEDEYSPKDRPHKFLSYPSPPHAGGVLSVQEFIKKY